MTVYSTSDSLRAAAGTAAFEVCAAAPCLTAYGVDMLTIFVLYPGKVRMRSLDKVINVSAQDLVTLYGLERRSCVLGSAKRTYESNESIRYVHVRPQESGVYRREDLGA